MGQRHLRTFRHAQRAAYRTAISAAQTCLDAFSENDKHSGLTENRLLFTDCLTEPTYFHYLRKVMN